MKIRGKERHFELNVQSYFEIEQICEGQDFANFGKLFEGNTSGQNIQVDMQVACILNKGFEDRMAFEDPDYKPEYLTMEDMKFMSLENIQKMEAELLEAVSTGQAVTIETEEPKPEPSSGKKTDADDVENGSASS